MNDELDDDEFEDDGDKLEPYELQVDIMLRYASGGNVIQLGTTTEVSMKEKPQATAHLRQVMALLQASVEFKALENQDLSMDEKGQFSLVPHGSGGKRRRRRGKNRGKDQSNDGHEKDSPSS